MQTEGSDEGPILVGIVARAHGLLGEVVVDALSDSPGRYAEGSAVTARSAGLPARPLIVAASRPFGDRLLVRFEGVTSRTEAERLHGADLTIDRAEVPPAGAGRHYRFELIGLAVRTREGESLGVVADVFATGSNDVYVVRGAKGEILLPALDTVVVEIAPERREMVVALPPGLLD